jgi:hypothetical protein
VRSIASGTARCLAALYFASMALFGLGSCSGHVGGNSTRDVLSEYAEALRDGRADDAYRLLSNEAKRSVSLEAFRRMVKENPEDAEDIARALTRPGNAPSVTAVVTAPNGDKLTLIYEDDRWTIDGTGIDRYGQATPRQALLGFLRAFDRKRFDVLMRYVPDAEREGRADVMWGSGTGAKEDGVLTAASLKKAWTGDERQYIASIIQAIKSALPTARIEQTEDRAAMPYGGGGTVLFVRENGLWKIEDLK